MKNKGYVKFWGQIRCIKEDVQVAYVVKCWKKIIHRYTLGKKIHPQRFRKKILTKTKSPQNSNGQPLTYVSFTAVLAQLHLQVTRYTPGGIPQINNLSG